MPSVLLAGSTGTLGRQIADQLLRDPAVDLRLLVRADTRQDADKLTLLTTLLRRGAVAVDGDLDDPASLDGATAGAEVVISAVQGRESTIVDGQLALARSAARSGARRFLASDYALDLFRAPSDAPMFAQRREAARQLDELRIEVVHPLCGGFMDGILDPRTTNVIDAGQRSVQCFGSGRERFDLTTIADAAAFASRLAVDPRPTDGVYRFAGAHTSAVELTHLLEDVTGEPFTVASGGTLEQLRSIIDQHADPWDAEMLWYALCMFSTPAFETLDNDRYPDVRVTTLREHLASAYAPAPERGSGGTLA